jgi:hypothetical protein
MLKYVDVSMTTVLLHCSTLRLRYWTMKFIVKDSILIVMQEVLQTSSLCHHDMVLVSMSSRTTSFPDTTSDATVYSEQ